MDQISVPARMNIADRCLDENLRRGLGQKVAVIADGVEYTYQQVAELSARVAAGLEALGVVPEQRVMILLPDSVEFVAAYFGAIRMGAIPIPTNTMLKPQDYGYLLEDSRASCLIGRSDYVPNVPASSPWLRHVVVVGGGREKKHVSWEQLIASGDPSYPAVERSCDDVAYWMYSSGTTGFPKAAMHLHQDVLFSLCYGQGVLGADQDCRMLSSSKMFFAYALGCTVHIPFLVGGTSIFHSGRSTPESLADLAATYRPTLFFSVPTFYAASLRAGIAGDAYGSVRFCVSAGEALPPPVYQAWLELTGKELVEHIGSTEFTYAFISNRPGQVRPGSSGTPVPGVEARIVDERLRDVEPFETGELLIKGNSTATAYWNRRRQTKETFLGEWLRTGDMFYRDADGYYWFCGRGNDMMKVSGIWVSPNEIEGVLAEHPAVQEAAVVGFPDAHGLIKPKAFVVAKRPVTEEALQAYVKDRLAPFKYPRWIEFVDELPRTATGKIQRYQLRKSC